MLNEYRYKTAYGLYQGHKVWTTDKIKHMAFDCGSQRNKLDYAEMKTKNESTKTLSDARCHLCTIYEVLKCCDVSRHALQKDITLYN